MGEFLTQIRVSLWVATDDELVHDVPAGLSDVLLLFLRGFWGLSPDEQHCQGGDLSENRSERSSFTKTPISRKTPRGGENSNEVHAPVKDHVQPAKGQLDDIWSLFWAMFVMWGVLFHSFHSCLEETNTIISSKSGLEPKQVLLLTALPTNLIVGLRFTAHPGIHRVLYLPGWWSSDFVDEMLGVVRFYHEFPRWYPLPEIRQLAAVNLLASWGVYVRSDQIPDRKLLYIHEAIWELQWTIGIQ